MAKSASAPARRRSKTAMRAAAIGALAVLLAGCYKQEEAAVLYPNDYRVRHPITLRDGQQAVEVFVGRARGGLSPEQRADVMSFAGNWKRQSTSGVLIEVPVMLTVVHIVNGSKGWYERGIASAEQSTQARRSGS